MKMVMRGPSVGAILVGVLWILCGFASPVAAQASGPMLGSVYVWVGLAVGMALILGLVIDAFLSRARARNMSALLSGLPSAVIELDQSGDVRFLNPRARKWLGDHSTTLPFPWPEDVRLLADGAASASGTSPADKSTVARILDGASYSGEILDLSRGEDPDQNRRVRVTTTSLAQQDQSRRMLLVMESAPNKDQKAPDSEQDHQQAHFTHLAQGIANDFNNALATIAYAIDLSLKQSLPEKAASLLMTALSTIERGQYITERMQTLAHASDNQTTSWSVLTMLEDIKTLMPGVLDRRIDLTLECAEPGLIVRCDQARLEKTLLTLTENAQDAILRHAQSGRITIAAKSAVIDDRIRQLRELQGTSQDFVELSVSDTGPGMETATCRAISNPLVKAEAQAKGIGPGLAMARAFVSDIRGDMFAETVKGKGTKVSILLPLEHLSARQSLGSEISAQRGNGETVFLVEDEPMLLLMLQEELEDLGYRVISATSGRAAIGLIEQGVEFDLVIADVVMPGDINGFDLAKTIRKLRHRSAVLYMSGYSGFTAEDMGEAKAPILKKPCPPNELAEAVQSALKERVM